jgi:hypothetical protein
MSPTSARAVFAAAASRGETISAFARKALAERLERLSAPDAALAAALSQLDPQSKEIPHE